MSHRFSSRLRAVAVSAALAVTSLAPVFAHDMDARLEINAEPATATRSSLALPTFAAYKITITSLETQTLRSVEFTGKTSIVGGSGAATFIAAIGATCTTTNVELTSVKCTGIGGTSVLPPLGSLTFQVAFKTPTVGTQIDFTGKSKTVEHYTETEYQVASASTLLEAPNPLKVFSFLHALTGGTLFTGVNAGVATRADPWTTTVRVPRSAAVVVDESADPDVADPTVCPFGYVCQGNFSKLRIPGAFDNLVITLRRDASTILREDHDDDDHDEHFKASSRGSDRGAKGGIKKAKVFYKADPRPGDPYPVYVEVLSCDITGGPVAGTSMVPGRPCIQSRTAYTKKTAPSPEWVGDWEFVILAKDNGTYEN